MGMDRTRLWAKSCPPDVVPRGSMYLGGHLRDVYDAADHAVRATGHSQLMALGLAPLQFDRLRSCVLLAAAVHDLGKANDHFQGMILQTRNTQTNPQGLRHEWVTVLLLAELHEWLLPAVGGSETDLAFVEWAVAGHHPAHNHDSPPRSCPPGGGAAVRVLTDHPDFVVALEWLKATFRLPNDPPPRNHRPQPLVGANNVFQKLAAWARRERRRWDVLTPSDRKLLAAVKNCLIAADVAGSALPKEGPPDFHRVTAAFQSLPAPADLQFLGEYGLEGREPRAFQTAVADHPDEVVFVKAGCGTGKTVAAYLRAARQWAGRRLYFCYPTTGTATEGFKDYLYPEYPEKPGDDTPDHAAARGRLRRVNADLFHSRSGVDFEIILGAGIDSGSAEADAAARADALAAWSTPVAACTVDTVLGLVQNNRRGLFAWPALAQSAFVFDEIHAYDDRLFGALLRFLRDLPGLPVLLMTASLPAPREEALREVLRRFRGIDLRPVGGPEHLETMPRYHKRAVPNNDPLELVKSEVGRGGKVLWVSNTVKRVMASADAAAGAGLKPQIYHSRFKYADRVERHRAVVEAFTPKRTAGVLACTSQVCEMSLDLAGCTLLVTEAAPVPALIQRLGRLNRHARPPETDGDPFPPTMPFVVLAPENDLPYTPTELAAAAEWLARLSDAAISQRALAAAWEQTREDPPAPAPSAWLDGGPCTTVSELREASPGVTVLLAGDLPKITKSCDLGKFTLPMPPPPQGVDWRTNKYKGIPVVSSDAVVYDPLRGAEWRRA